MMIVKKRMCDTVAADFHVWKRISRFRMVAADFNRRMPDNRCVGEFIRLFPVLMCVFVSGCALPQEIPGTGSGTVRDLLRTASGYVIEGTKQAAATIELGKMGYEKAKSAAGDFQQRAGEFQEGVENVRKGKELMEKGLAK